MKILILAFLASNIPLISSVVIQCDNYKTSVWWYPDAVYECEDMHTDILLESDRYVTSAVGKHHFGRENRDVNSLWVHKGTINYFPRNIENFYPILIGLIIIETNITEIHSDDLKPFNELIRLNLGDNKISILENDLFMHNPKLQQVGFSNNRIKHIDSKVFIHLNDLKTLHFKNNDCYSGEVKNDRVKTLFLAWNIQHECFDIKYARIKAEE